MSASSTTTTTTAAPESGNCPICGTLSSTEFHRDTGKKSLKRLHLLCRVCSTIFVPPSYFVTDTTEKSRYDNHNNNSVDEGYRTFLNQSVRPLVLYLCLRKQQQQSQQQQQQNLLREVKGSSTLDEILEEEDYSNNSSSSSSSYSSRHSVYFARHFTQLRLPRGKQPYHQQAAAAVLSPEQETEIALTQSGLDLEKRILEETRVQIISRKLENGNSDCCDNDSNSPSESNSRDNKKKNELFTGLDFGCGPGPTLNKMILGEIPFLVRDPIALYDKFYFPKEEGVFYNRESRRRKREEQEEEKPDDVEENSKNKNDTDNQIDELKACRENRNENDDENEDTTATTTTSIRTNILYDFITATEVAEHIANAGEELTKLWAHVKPNGGVLIIQTSRTEAHCGPNEKSIPSADPEMLKLEQESGVNISRYGQWHYIRDDTHICLFNINSFEYLRQQWGKEVKCMIVCGPSVVMFVKN